MKIWHANDEMHIWNCTKALKHSMIRRSPNCHHFHITKSPFSNLLMVIFEMYSLIRNKCILHRKRVQPWMFKTFIKFLSFAIVCQILN